MKMRMPDIKKKAKALGVNAGRMKKPDLIRAIQKAEGYTACFGSGDSRCPQLQCCWRGDCIPAVS